MTNTIKTMNDEALTKVAGGYFGNTNTNDTAHIAKVVDPFDWWD